MIPHALLTELATRIEKVITRSLSRLPKKRKTLEVWRYVIYNIAVMKYDIDENLKGLAKLRQPMNGAFFAIANTILRPFYRLLKGKDILYEKLCVDSPYGKVRIHLIRKKELTYPLPCIIYYHGGAFMRRAAPHHYRNAKSYALNCDCAVAFVDFCLAPKNRSTRIEGQCLAAYEYLIENESACRLDGRRFMIAGDSSGGFLALKTIKLLRNDEKPLPLCNMLLYPLIYGLEDTLSVQKYTDTPVWDSTILPKLWEKYLDGDYEWVKPEEVAMPTYMEIAEFDCLHDADVRFCRQLEEVGAPVEMVLTERTLHGYDAVDYALTRQCLERRFAFIRKHLHAADGEKNELL